MSETPKRAATVLPFVPTEPRRGPSEADVIAVCYSFMAWQQARAERIALTPKAVTKPERRKS